MKEEDDGSITELQEPAAVAKKPRGRPKKIKVMKEEDDGSITELQEPAVQEPAVQEPVVEVQMQEPVVQEPVPEPEKEPVVPAKKARVRKLKLVIED